MQLDILATARSVLSVALPLRDYEKDIENNVVAAWAPALAAAYQYNLEAGCVAWVNEGGCIWTEGHPDEQTYCPESAAPEGV
jgi:hypothetical protein